MSEPKKLTLAQRTALEEWSRGRPAKIVAAAHKHPPFGCYRDKSNPRTHYIIHAFEEDTIQPSAPVRCKIVHGSDSTMPGVMVFGVDPETLVACDCEQWQPPTAAQVEAMQEHFAALEKARALAPKPEQKH